MFVVNFIVLKSVKAWVLGFFLKYSTPLRPGLQKLIQSYISPHTVQLTDVGFMSNQLLALDTPPTTSNTIARLAAEASLSVTEMPVNTFSLDPGAVTRSARVKA